MNRFKTYLIMLLLLLPFAASAQTATDSLGIYAVFSDTIVQMKSMMPAKPEVKRKGFRFYSYTIFKRPTSTYRFSHQAKFRVYLREQSTLEVDDLGFANFIEWDGHRALLVSEGSARGVKSLPDISEQLCKRIRQLSEYVYEITVEGQPGEYCITPFVNGTAGHGNVWDFTITAD